MNDREVERMLRAYAEFVRRDDRAWWVCQWFAFPAVALFLAALLVLVILRCK